MAIPIIITIIAIINFIPNVNSPSKIMLFNKTGIEPNTKPKIAKYVEVSCLTRTISINFAPPNIPARTPKPTGINIKMFN